MRRPQPERISRANQTKTISECESILEKTEEKLKKDLCLTGHSADYNNQEGQAPIM